MTGGYQLLGEGPSSPLAKLAVRPLWPLVSIMFAGAWLAWPWFLLNAFATESPTRVRECLWAAGALLGSVIIGLFIAFLDAKGVLATRAHLQYALVLLTVWKLGAAYVLYMLQSRSIELYAYYGGALRNGLWVLLAGVFLRGHVLGAFDHALWWMVLL